MDDPSPLLSWILAVGALSLVVLAYVIPILFGRKWARQSDRSATSLWWFAAHPLAGWIAVAVLRWGLVDVVAGRRVQTVSGKAMCEACGQFNALESTFCSKCASPNPHPVCPRCHHPNTTVLRQVPVFFFMAILLLVFAAGLTQGTQALAPRSGALTWAMAITILLSLPFFAGAIVYGLVLPFRRRRIRCTACRKISKLAEVREFRRPGAPASVPAPGA